MSGMRPRLSFASDGKLSREVTVLLVRRDPAADAMRFQYMALKTNDPADRYESAMQFLSSTYYQRPKEFSDELTALFQPPLLLVRALLAKGDCMLDFEQFGTCYGIPCTVRQLAEDELAYQTTYWHNRLFNPNMPGNIIILGFLPNWNQAETDLT